MNSNVTNVRKNFPSSYQSLIMNERNILLVLIVKVEVRREYFRDLLQSLLKRADDMEYFIKPLLIQVCSIFLLITDH